MEILTVNQIKQLYPNEWVLISIEDSEPVKRPEKGSVLLHGKDYLELCYKASEVTKDYITTMFFTGKITQKRKWLKSTRL